MNAVAESAAKRQRVELAPAVVLESKEGAPEKRQKEFEDKFGKQPEKVDTIDALWSIADDMRERKEAGKFSTYMEAYRWASKHMTSNGKSFTAESLQNEYHKAKSKGVVD